MLLTTLWLAMATRALADRSTSFTSDPMVVSMLCGNDNYYNVEFDVGGQPQQARLDINQPEIWVMDSDSFTNCKEVDSWWSSVTSHYSDEVPESLTTEAYYTLDVCVSDDGYSPPAKMAKATGEVENGDSVVIPYLLDLNASGTWATDDVVVNFTSQSIELANFTFANANDSSLSYGGFGLATNPRGSGFLSRLVSKRVIKSPSYSLWFSSTLRSQKYVSDDKYGYLIAGAVDPESFEEPMLVFPMVNHKGYRYPVEDNEGNSLVGNLNLPIVVLDDIIVHNKKTGAKLGLISTAKSANPVPVMLDSRSVFTFLPTSLLLDIATQTNAYYVEEVGRWFVSCDAMRNANSSLNFKLNDLTVEIPLSELVMDAVWDTQLKFQNNKDACYLLFLSEEVCGGSTLGIPFLEQVVVAVDNDGGDVGIALRKSNWLPSKREVNGTGSDKTSSAAVIESGFIPYASTVTSSVSDYVYSYSQVKDEAVSVPARFSGAIAGGSVVVTGYYTSGMGALSAASLQTSTAKAEAGTSTHQPGWLPLKWATLYVAIAAFSAIVIM
ncbi:hypothetical protein DICA4_F19086 [Diutina catenulata]